MRAHQARYVTACQQLLALGLVLAALTPAAGVVSLDVVATPAPMAAEVRFAADDSADRPATVATAPVAPHVAEVQLTASRGSRQAASSPLQARSMQLGSTSSTRVVSAPQPVLGYGAVGVTWDPQAQVADGAISLQARTKSGGEWSRWSDIAYDADHGPDPGSREARRARPGSDPLLVGRVDRVQVRSTSAGAAPADMKLAVIDPGATAAAGATATALPALDTASMSSSQSAGASVTEVSAGAATYTPAPSIFSRAQWGADERDRDTSSLRYYEVHAGFVHHTVNSNSYSEADVPALLRSIYAYHTQSRGWSDIGYNFLVDRFGRVWEGRAGGIDRPVVGAHTLGYNDYSFAMSAIGNFETVQPSDAVLRAYGAVFAWKLSLHGVSAASVAQRVGSKSFPAINGHRDAGSTACPGRYLYAQLPLIRQYAVAGQQGWTGRERESNLAGSAHPDLIVRRDSDGQGFVIPTQGSAAPLGAPVDTGWDLTGSNALLNVGDWDRDGFGDFMTRLRSDGNLYLYRGNGQGQFAPPVPIGTGFKGVRLLAAVGDVTGDGWPDLMGQPRKAAMRIYPGAGTGFLASYTAYSKIKAKRQVGVGRMDADGAPDSIFRRKKNLVLLQGNGPGGLSGPATKVRGRLQRFDWTIGVSDLDLSGHADVLVRKKRTGQLFVLQGNEKRFSKPVLLGGGMKGYDLAD